MKTAHKIRINPTPEQVEYLKRACGTRRFSYNWGRADFEAEYQAYKLEQETVPEAERTLKPPNALGLKKQFNAIRETAYLWTYDVTKCVVEGAFDDLEKAYANFFAGRAQYRSTRRRASRTNRFICPMINSRWEASGSPFPDLAASFWISANKRRIEASSDANWERSIWPKSCALSSRGRQPLQ